MFHITLLSEFFNKRVNKGQSVCLVAETYGIKAAIFYAVTQYRLARENKFHVFLKHIPWISIAAPNFIVVSLHLVYFNVN
jgi:hypothetical protein